MRWSKYDVLKKQKIRYLIAGAFNTGVGYVTPLVLYQFFAPQFSAAVISAFAAFLAISVAFLVYRSFVFKSEGNFVLQYAKCYLVYGSIYTFGVGAIWLLVDVGGLNYFLVQTVINTVVIVLSYISHKYFTFNSGFSLGRK